MSRKSKIITIDGLGEVTVKEVSPFAAYNAMLAKNKIDELKKLAAECISMPEGKDLKKLYASEIEQVIDAFVEVNSSFLAVAGKLKLKAAIATITEEVVSELSKVLPQVYVDSYKKVMQRLPGIMAGAASLSPSKP